MSKRRSREWLLPAGLILLSLVPAAAGTVRLAQIGSGTVTHDNARFLNDPMPAAAHIFSVIIYSILGAFQFAPAFRRRKPQWHRMAGKVLIPLGLVSALTGLWMTLHYPWVEHDGFSLYVIRLIIGTAMTMFLCLGIAAIQQRDFKAHGRWMVRAYALGLGAGTQVFTHLPWFLIPSIQGGLSRTVCMGLGWAINVVVAERFIRSMQGRTRLIRTD